MSRMTPKRRATRTLWEDQSVEYNTEAPSVVTAMRNERWKRIAVKAGLFVVLPVTLLTSLSTIASPTGRDTGTDVVSSTGANSSPGKSAAYAEMSRWLSSDPSPLPDGQIVSWDGFTLVPTPAPQAGDNGKAIDYRFELHEFTLERGGARFAATVQVAVNDLAGATAVGSPNLAPVAATAVDVDSPWFGVTSTNAPKPVAEAVSSWADAFTSGDPDELRRTVQDKSTEHAYVPLSGVSEVAGTTIVTAGFVPTGDDKQAKPDTLIVRVQLTVWWDGQKQSDTPGSTPEKGTAKPTPISYDLLVHDAQSASPVVVAWGGPGTGPELRPHGNALVGVDVSVTDPTPAPTGTPESTDTTNDGEAG